MQDIQKMTDAELVEAVAREVLNITNYKVFDRIIQPIVKWENIDTYPEAWRPFSDMNDLFRMLEKFDNWQVDKMTTQDGSVSYQVIMYDGEIIVIAETLPRAILEAVLSAERGK